MIVSHARKFIFVKTKKTAGTSMEIALSKHCGPQDVLTELDQHDEAKRVEVVGSGARNFALPFGQMSVWDKARFLTGRRKPSDGKLQHGMAKFHEHERAARVRTLLGPEVFGEYYKFAVVRNPFDQAVSNYFWMRNNGDPTFETMGIKTFSQFLRHLPEQMTENWRILTHGDEILVDDVVRYERLEEDLRRVSARIGLGRSLYEDLKGIRTKGGTRPRDRSFAELFGPGDRELIEQLCRREIEAFGYAYEELVDAA